MRRARDGLAYSQLEFLDWYADCFVDCTGFTIEDIQISQQCRGSNTAAAAAALPRQQRRGGRGGSAVAATRQQSAAVLCAPFCHTAIDPTHDLETMTDTLTQHLARRAGKGGGGHGRR